MKPVISTELQGDLLIVRALPATIDIRNSKDFRAEVEEAAKPAANVLIDLTNVEFMDSSALGCLIPLLRNTTAKGGDLRLCSLGPKIQVLFEITRLYKVFSIWPDRESAVQSFNQ